MKEPYVRVTLHAVSIEMRCKDCGNGVAGIERCPADSIGKAIEHFEDAARSHIELCTAQHRPIDFDIVVTNADVTVQ